MKNLLLATALLLLSACATALPPPDASTSLVLLAPSPGNALLASKLNGGRVEHGGYFSVAPGANDLEVLVLGTLGEHASINRFVELTYARFVPGRTYRVELSEHGLRQVLRLLDSDGTVLSERLI